MTEDEMVGWHDLLDGPLFEQAPRASSREAWGCKESDTTE